MTTTITQEKILAFAVYELRLLLAGQLDRSVASEPSVHAAARLAYALHNQALAVLEGRSFNSTEAVEAISRVDKMLGEDFVQQLLEATNRKV